MPPMPQPQMPPMMRQEAPVEMEEPEGVQSNGFMGMMGNMMSGLGAAMPAMPTAGPPQAHTARREMRGPTGVDDILRQLNEGGQSLPNPPRGGIGIDSEDIASVGSGYTTETMRRNGLNRRSRKTTSTQPTGNELTLNV